MVIFTLCMKMAIARWLLQEGCCTCGKMVSLWQNSMRLDDSLDCHPSQRHPLSDSQQQTSVPHSQCSKEARDIARTMLKMMKLYLTSRMRCCNPESYTTWNPHSAWKDQTVGSKWTKELRYITITFLP